MAAADREISIIKRMWNSLSDFSSDDQIRMLDYLRDRAITAARANGTAVPEIGEHPVYDQANGRAARA